MADDINNPSAEDQAGRKIDKAEFLEMTRAYREERLSLITRYGNNQNDSRSCFYSREVFEAMLQSDCTGIRVYYGVRKEPTDGKQYTTLLLVAVKKNAATGAEEVVKIINELEEGDLMYEWGALCPPGHDCSENTLLKEIDEE